MDLLIFFYKKRQKNIKKYEKIKKNHANSKKNHANLKKHKNIFIKNA